MKDSVFDHSDGQELSEPRIDDDDDDDAYE